MELNSSFYRVPTAGQVERWAEVGRALRWAVKVHKGVTHFGKLSEKALERLEGFLAVFRPLDYLIDFYLFQITADFPQNCRKHGTGGANRPASGDEGGV